ncbi:AzlC family ABC transporter permease [Serinibacter salmoneus]|uniref:4-azaleucine resistance transporter AzlC n=1 Tax=Serinibacter salmoneus TaxID=556530 RepID=A0A2A9D1L4_9MICO|nr:AzlC family ABC transporter permease [Serinibacter salmoneus]PFG20145.1 4-azaleucine resistance transporter AzlC [Serinibacter salmoneus]
MASLWTSVPAELRRAVLLVTLAVALVGVAYGVTATANQFAVWQILVLAVLVLAGSAELLFVGLIGAGASPWLALGASLLLNLRNVVYGMACSPLLPAGWRRWAGAHLVNDETVALAAAPSGDRPAELPPRTLAQRWATFLVSGIGVAVGWPFGALIGATLGQVVPEPELWGLDAVLPALLGALAMPAVRNGSTFAVAVLAAAIALVVTPVVPLGVAPIAGLAALVVLLLARRPGGGDQQGGDQQGGIAGAGA